VPNKGQPGSLRALKRWRAQEAIRRAALELFGERGFDAVTVDDIAARAEVGRTTFFRYFGDKQEVLFKDSEHEASDVLRAIAPPPHPIGASLEDAVDAARKLVLAFVEHITVDPDAYVLHQRLVSQHPELYARSLVKQRAHTDALAAQLVRWGAERVTARLAAELGIACFYAGQAAAGDRARVLGRRVADAFAKLRGKPR
jgi:AcrR family transcriptional regulator